MLSFYFLRRIKMHYKKKRIPICLFGTSRTQDIANHFHNILRLFDVLTNFFFTTSETMRNSYLQTRYTRVALRIVKRLKKYQESPKTSQNDSLVPSSTPEMKILLILAKKLFSICKRTLFANLQSCIPQLHHAVTSPVIIFRDLN